MWTNAPVMIAAQVGGVGLLVLRRSGLDPDRSCLHLPPRAALSLPRCCKITQIVGDQAGRISDIIALLSTYAWNLRADAGSPYQATLS
jgi:hypothetical protein